MQLDNSIESKLTWKIAEQHEVQVYIKRDDLIHPVVSGNKWRKLQHIFEFAKSENKESIVTFGGAYSNHLLATACASNLYGFKSTGFVRGERPATLNHMLGLCLLYNMDLKFVSREAYKDKKRVFEEHFKGNENTLFVDEGGRDPLAVKGCHGIVDELKGKYDYIAVSCGTATTMEGILEAIQLNGIETKVLGFSALKSNDEDKSRLSRFPNSSYEWHDETVFGGYAKCNSTLSEFIKEFVSETGILVDQVYNGKMFYKLANQISEGKFKRGDKILAIHTGGLHGLLSEPFLKLL